MDMGPCGFTTFSIECGYFDTAHTAICGEPDGSGRDAPAHPQPIQTPRGTQLRWTGHSHLSGQTP
eukprot:5601409-Amphidinium_carterae.1